VDEDRNVNDVIEEAMRDLVKKYKRKGKGWGGDCLSGLRQAVHF